MDGDAGREWDPAYNRSTPIPPQHFHHQTSYPPRAWARKGSQPVMNESTNPLNLTRPTVFSSSSTPSLFSRPPLSPPMSPNASRSASGVAQSSNASRPLAALAGSSAGSSRKTARFDSGISSASAGPLSAVEKDADDPTTMHADGRKSLEGREKEYATLSALSQLFTVQGSEPPESSRTPMTYQPFFQSNARLLCSEAASLPDHLYKRGFLGGRHSDITVLAFGQRHALHRIILDRAPFFTSALSEPWAESSAKEIALHPEDIDSNITQAAFLLALKHLYGCNISTEAESEAVGVFATACWLEVQDLIEYSVELILRQMNPDRLSQLIKLVTANYYGRPGERILASAKAMLCRDGWDMPLKYWDAIPGDIIREIVGGDGFFVDGEWDRWILAKRILKRRLKQRAAELGLYVRGSKVKPKPPDTLGMMALRFDTVYRRDAMVASRSSSDSHNQWVALYTHPDIEPLLVLLDEGIHYVYLEFEQLQYIREARDTFGLPLLPEKVITNALWMGMELRQKVVNAQENEMELGLTKIAEEASTSRPADAEPMCEGSSAQSVTVVSKGKQKSCDTPTEEKEEEMESGSWDANGKPRKFWVPSADCNIVMGGHSEPVMTTSNSIPRQAFRLSTNLEPGDAQWATDFAASPAANLDPQPTSVPRPRSSSGRSSQAEPNRIAYTNFPPFRFAAEFPNPRLLKEKKRVYSRTVFYAGSLWNIYIQRVRSSKNAQLGVYLHRAKEREADDITGSSTIAQGSVANTSVDERIGFLEREMLLRSERSERRRGTRGSARAPLMTGDISNAARDAEDTSGSGGDPDSTLVARGSGSALANGQAPLTRAFHPTGHGSQPSADLKTTTIDSTFVTTPSRSPSPTDYCWDSDYSSGSDESDADALGAMVDRFMRTNGPLCSSLSRLAPAGPEAGAPGRRPAHRAFPAYIDGRPTIRTYFKIYSPSRGGRLLSVYESAPDSFNFSQSWGWKSSTLMLDDGLLDSATGSIDGAGFPGVGSQADGAAAAAAAGGVGVRGAGNAAELDDASALPTGIGTAPAAPGTEILGSSAEKTREMKRHRWRRREGVLRFMVVIGNV